MQALFEGAPGTTVLGTELNFFLIRLSMLGLQNARPKDKMEI